MQNVVARTDNAHPRTVEGPCLTLGVQAYGTFGLSLADIQPLRKQIPAWAPPDTPGHFFKYSDEQTIVAVQALDRLITDEAIDVSECREWGVIASPRFIGRLAGAATLKRFGERGDQGVSPHTLPQFSLHSPSGAMSILLGTHGPNVGMGGGPNALAEGLLAALTVFDHTRTPGMWFVATDWDPEPLPSESGDPATEGYCHAVVLLLRQADSAGLRGQLSLRNSTAPLQTQHAGAEIRASQLVRDLDVAAERSLPLGFQWELPWGGRIEMQLETAATKQEVAA